MHRFPHPTTLGTIRVWTQRTSPDGLEFDTQHEQLTDCLQDDDPITAMLKLPFVSAIEDLNVYGNGRLVYVDWP